MAVYRCSGIAIPKRFMTLRNYQRYCYSNVINQIGDAMHPTTEACL